MRRKKVSAVLLAMGLVVSLAACGDSGKEEKAPEDKAKVEDVAEDDGEEETPEEKTFITEEDYERLRNAENPDSLDMTLEQMEEFLGVKAIIKEDISTEDHLSVYFPGEDESLLRINAGFTKTEDGKWDCSGTTLIDNRPK